MRRREEKWEIFITIFIIIAKLRTICTEDNKMRLLPQHKNVYNRQHVSDVFIKNAIYGLCLLLVGCSPKAIKNQSTTVDEKPAWLRTRPISDNYYVGIGRSIKRDTLNYIQQAKKNALDDMASEIKINISSVATLSQIASDKTFREQYEQIIKTTVSNELEGYEQIDSWQDNTNYWVYYRLSKAYYSTSKKAQKKNAVDKALDLFMKAKQHEKKNNDVQAIAFYFRSLISVEKYLKDPLRVPYQGQTILLINEIYASIQHLLNDITLSATPKNITINRRIGSNPQIITVRALQKNTNHPIGNLPIAAKFKQGSGTVLADDKTDNKGISRMLISRISTKDAQQTIQAKVNLIDLGGEKNSAIDTLIANKIITPQVSVLLNVLPPTVYVTLSKKVPGERKESNVLAEHLQNHLTKAGCILTRLKSQSELWIDIKTHSEKGAVSGSLYAAYATATITVTDQQEKNEIYTATLDRIKGYSLNYKGASRAAYNKLIATFEKNTLPELIKNILK